MMAKGSTTGLDEIQAEVGRATDEPNRDLGAAGVRHMAVSVA